MGNPVIPGRFFSGATGAAVLVPGAAVGLLESDEGGGLVRKLQENVAMLASGLLAPAQSAIFPVIVGGEEVAMNASRTLLAENFLVPAIRYPTVARGSARLRITVTAAHQREMIERLVTAVRKIPATTL